MQAYAQHVSSDSCLFQNRGVTQVLHHLLVVSKDVGRPLIKPISYRSASIPRGTSLAAFPGHVDLGRLSCADYLASP